MRAESLEIISQGLDGLNFSSVPIYQLSREEADIPAMVDYAQSTLVKERRQALAASLVSGIWSDEYPSVRSFGYRRIYRGYSLRDSKRVHVLEPMVGSINVPADRLGTSPLGDFFTPLRRRSEGNFIQLRGLTYHVSQDHSKSTPAKKLEVMKKDIAEGLNAIISVDRKGLDPVSYLLYLGILDYFKTHSLTAFHVLTFHERTGLIPDDAEYMGARKEAQRLMLTTTRAYYQAILGQPFDMEFNPSYIRSAMEKVSGYIVSSDHSIAHFTFAESNNPLTIMLGAYEAVSKKPQQDLIIGIPSGGTEVAVATSLAYELLYRDRNIPDMVFIPLSFHYHDQHGIDPDRLVAILRSSTNIEGKSVLIVDDNSNTGSTIQRMVDATITAGASNIRVHIAEIDFGRLLANARKENFADFGKAKVVNLYHGDFRTAMGTAWTSDSGDDLRRKDAGRFVQKTHRKIEKKTAGYNNP